MGDSAACPSCGRAVPEGAVCGQCATRLREGVELPTVPLSPGEAISSSPRIFAIEGYRILRKLGQGGMGVVYLAEDTVLNRRVAIKVMTAGLAHEPAAGAFFLREARAMATVEHPNVVRMPMIFTYRDSLL